MSCVLWFYPEDEKRFAMSIAARAEDFGHGQECATEKVCIEQHDKCCVKKRTVVVHCKMPEAQLERLWPLC